MSYKSYEGPLKHISLFSKSLPSNRMLLLMLIAIGLITGIASAALMNYSSLAQDISYVISNGILTGVFGIIIPATLAVVTIKMLRRYVAARYILFSTIIATVSYSIFFVLAAAVYAITHNYSFPAVIILLGDASTFGWWLFISKILLNEKLRAVPFALIQPTLNILFLIPGGRFIFAKTFPLNILLIKLYAGIFVFLVVVYFILYIMDMPLRKSLGFSGIDAFTQMLQNWLFDVNITINSKNLGLVGTFRDIEAQMLVFKNPKGVVKSIFFIPEIHYGPMGTIGSSNFPYMLEYHGIAKHKANTFIMHPAVSEDNTASYSSQYAKVVKAFDECFANLKRVECKQFTFARSGHNGATINVLGFGPVGLATLSRAPRVTEDITSEASALFKKALEANMQTPILIDAHNSRYETAPLAELAAVKFDSPIAKDYLHAIKYTNKILHSGKSMRFGSSSMDLYNSLHEPKDLAPGNLNVAIFKFNGFSYCIIHINANNLLPSLRSAVLNSVKDKYGIDAEMYTTDTHYVNSFRDTASNVFGSVTKENAFLKALYGCIDDALADMENVNLYYGRSIIKNFRVWGTNERDRIITAINSMLAIAKLLVPITIIIGFFIAALVISLI